jgi:hypothetical protein
MPIKTESKFLNELVKDCITYGLEEREANHYLEVRFKPVSYPHSSIERLG